VSASKVNLALGGASELIRQLKLADPATHARVAAVIERETQAIATQARASAPRRTGEMASTIRADFSANGLIGYVRVGIGKLRRRSQSTGKRHRRRTVTTGPGAYAPVIEYGDPRRHRRPEPFVRPALSAHKAELMGDLDAAMGDVVKDIAK
jgi:hypothetical protein